MTTTAMNSIRARAASERASVPRRSDFLCRWFSWWVRGYLEKHFHAVRLSRGSRPNVSPDLPLIVALNHPSWWDPLMGVILAGLFPERTHFAPMDAQALARYSLFDKLGFYGVEQGTLAGPSLSSARRRPFWPSRSPQCGLPFRASLPIHAFDLLGYARESATLPGA